MPSVSDLVGITKLKFHTYSSLYENVFNRVVKANLVGVEDLLIAKFDNSSGAVLEHYRTTPSAVSCVNRCWGSGRDLDAVYLVVGGAEKVVLLLPPLVALERNLPYIAVLEGQHFKPYVGCANTYWQTHIEQAMLNEMTLRI